ncbi:MAG: Nif3-like dinuclear metal center hexameric protein [Candidatus Sumerlaeia bacterium]|nr:Nif3-like dinuclear metal center hexameric protein [Candidatus Sumerlaeia bacterium]
MAKKSKAQAKVSDLVAAVHRIAPPQLAESWDNVGLQFGDPTRPSGKIMVALEVTREVLAETRKLGVGSLVTHHPLLFLPQKTMAETNTVAQLGAEIIRQEMALVAAHTNLDSVANGTNGVLADLLGVQAAERKFLQPVSPASQNVKFAVFVPMDHIGAMIEAIHRAGAGVIGDYSHCTFRTPGTGTFRPLEGADPYSGKVGELAHEEEVRLECVCPKNRLDRLITEARAAHPYEEMAFDVLPLHPTEKPTAGLGLIGNLKKETTLEGLARAAKKALGIKSAGLVGDGSKKISRVAICTGAGGSIIRNWRPGTADVLITGEMTHHDCAEAHHRGICVLLVGHWASEAIVSPTFAGLIGQNLATLGFPEAEVIISKAEIDPLRRL